MEHTSTGPLTIQTDEAAPGTWTVRVEGSVRFENYTVLEKAIKEVLQKGAGHVIIDLQGAEQISSSGYGCLIDALSVLKKRGGNMLFAGTPDPVREVLCNLLGLSKILQFEPDVDAALAAIR